MGRGGLEQPRQTPGNPKVVSGSGAESGAELDGRDASAGATAGGGAGGRQCDGYETATNPPEASGTNPGHSADLDRVIAAWASLPPAVRAGIVAMVVAANDPESPHR